MRTAALPDCRPTALAALSALLLALCLSHTAAAEDKPGANKALRRAQMEAAKAQQEKAAVESERNELAGKLEKAEAEARKNDAAQRQARGELLALQKALAAAKARADALQAQDEGHVQQARETLAETVKAANERFDHYETDITALRQRVAEAEAHGRELEHQVQVLSADKSRLTADLGERSDSLGSCEAKNATLFQLNAQLRQQYQDKGLLAVLRGGEPVTGLARVREQNALQDIEDKAYDARVSAANR